MDNSSLSGVSIVIATTGQETLAVCLKNIIKIKKDYPLDIQTLVVFDATVSTSIKQSIQDHFPDFEYFQAQMPGVSAARNLGLKQITHDFILVIDDDCLISAENIFAMFRACSQKDFLLFGCRLSPMSNTYWPRVYDLVQELWLMKGFIEQSEYTVHLIGGAIFGRRKVMQLVHFPEEFFWGGEEVEMIYRLAQNFEIKSCLEKSICIAHDDRGSLKKICKRAWRQGLSKRRRLIQPLTDISWLSEILKNFELIPGLIFFVSISYAASLWGRLLSRSKLKQPQSSPIA